MTNDEIKAEIKRLKDISPGNLPSVGWEQTLVICERIDALKQQDDDIVNRFAPAHVNHVNSEGTVFECNDRHLNNSGSCLRCSMLKTIKEENEC